MAQDTEALLRALDGIGPRVRSAYSSKLKKLQSRIGVDDLLQEISLRAIANFSQYRGSTDGELHAWVGRIAENVSKSLLTREHAGKRSVDHEEHGTAPWLPDDIGEQPDFYASLEDEAAKIRRAMEALSYRQYFVVRGIYFEQRTVEEVAEDMRLSLGAVRSLLSKAVVALRSRLYRSAGGPRLFEDEEPIESSDVVLLRKVRRFSYQRPIQKVQPEAETVQLAFSFSG